MPASALSPTPTVRSDERLVELTLSGDLRAFAELVERHRSLVFRVAARIVGPNDADDVTQDVFLRAFHRLDQFRGEAQFRSWLLRIAYNTALNELERRKPSIGTDLDEAASVPAHERTPADELELAERRSRLALKLGEVQPVHRTVLVLRDLEGLSYEEIAEVVDSPLGTVKGRLFRARRELIDVLRNNTYDWELPA